MFDTRKRQVPAAQANEYATHQDFCRIFNEEMAHLYLLALLLTANQEHAERCFAAALEDCQRGRRVFKEWARSWSKRAIVKRAIEMVLPAPNSESILQVSDWAEQGSNWNSSLAAITQLPPFQRFVFVMSVLERYSVQDCSTLLSGTRQDVLAARSRALQQLAITAGNTSGVPASGNLPFAQFLEPAHAA